MRPSPDHELYKVVFDGPTDQRIALQHIDCRHDDVNVRWRVCPLTLKEVIQNAIEIVADLGSEFDARHH